MMNQGAEQTWDLLITRTFLVPVAVVWRMWAEQELRAQWWGPEGFSCISLLQDFRPGGLWHAHIISAAEGELHASGVFREIDHGKRLTFSFRWEARPREESETMCSVLFEQGDGFTIQHFYQTPFRSVESRDGHVGGWNSSFNRLNRLSEQLASAMGAGGKHDNH